MATRAWARCTSTAMRRVVVTPTFAAGLGVVLAAVLAYPMTRTVISYGREPPAGGSPCQVKGCQPDVPGGGSLASATPGSRLVTPRPAHLVPSPGAAGGQAVMRYKTVKHWPGGFTGEITIIPPAGSGSANWRIRLTYPSAQILRVAGGTWLHRGDHTAVVVPYASKHSSHARDGSIVLYIAAVGSPAPPSRCFYDGHACRVG